MYKKINNLIIKLYLKKIYNLTPAEKEWDHIRIITDINVKIPSRTRAILYAEDSPVPAMVESINLLEDHGADLIAIPCNSAHNFYESVQVKINLHWINMVQVVCEEVKRVGLSSPLIIGGYVTYTKRLYSKYCPKSVYLDELDNNVIVEIIEYLKKNSSLNNSRKSNLLSLLNSKKYKFDSIILACTELSIIQNEIKNKIIIPIFDSSLEYATKIVHTIKNL